MNCQKCEFFLVVKQRNIKWCFVFLNERPSRPTSVWRKKNIEICSSPTLQLQAVSWASGILSESDRSVKLHSSEAEAPDEKWEVKHFIVLLFGRTGLPHPSTVHGQCSFAFYSNSQTFKCLINLVFWFKCFLLILLRWVIKRVGKTQLKYERKNICFRDLYFALNWGFVDSYQLSYKYLVPRENQTLQSPVNNNKIYQPQGGDLKYNYSRLVVVI